MTSRIGSTLLMALVVCACRRPRGNPRADPLGGAISPLVTLDPAARFDDLAPLGRRIGSAPVVMLGEARHADPMSTRAQDRLVRYLHEALGFDVILWETSLFGCHDANTELARGTFLIDRCLFRMWAESADVRELLEYVRATQRSPHPLVFEGIDPQLAGERAFADFVAWVRTIASRVAPELAARLETALARFPKLQRFRPLTAADREVDRAVFEILARRVRDPDAGAAEPDVEWAARVLDGIVALYRWHEDVHAETSTSIDWNAHPEANDVRDAAMASNALWLIGGRYAGHRVIVWSATLHALRRPEAIGPFRNLASMGRLVADRLDPDPFVIASTGVPEDGSPGAGCIEEALRRRGVATALIDVARAMPNEGCTAALGFQPFHGRWSATIDELLFVDQANAARPRRAGE